MKSSRTIYLIMFIVFLLIIFGLVYRLTQEKDVNNISESHTGYPY